MGKTHVNLGALATINKVSLASSMPMLGCILVFSLAPAIIRYFILAILTVLCFIFPTTMVNFTMPLVVIFGSLFADLDHPNSTLSNMIAPTGSVVRILLMLVGGVLCWHGWSIDATWLVFLGGILTVAALINTLPRDLMGLLQRVLLLVAGAALIGFSDNTILQVLGVVYFTMGILSHRGLTHSTEGAILIIIGAFLLTNNIGYPNLFMPFTIAYIVHLLADLITNSGIYLSYIAKVKISIKLVNTNSIVDKLIGYGALVIFLAITVANVSISQFLALLK